LNSYVIDTNVLFWQMTQSSRITRAAADVFIEAEAGRAHLVVPFIVLAELYYLNNKYGRPIDFVAELTSMRSAPNVEFVLHEPDDLLEFDHDAAVSEMHDRLVVGIARRMGLPCVTSDQSIHDSKLVPIIW
jgi:predicted nucleic acid-binding protein